MPRTPIDYSKTNIYKLVCNDLNIAETYVGHTTCFRNRKNQHKHACNDSNNKRHGTRLYQFIRDNGGWDNFSMVLVEEYPCESLLQACQKERFWIEKLVAELNCQTPSRDKKQYYIENRKEIVVYRKNYYNENKEKKQKYRNENKEQIRIHKQKYAEEHKEHIKAYMREYRLKQKAKKQSINNTTTFV